MLTSLRLIGFKNFRDTTLNMGPLTVLVGANASGKSNLRDAFRFLHGIGRGYSFAEIIGERYGTGGELVWSGIRGGVREISFKENRKFSIEADFTTPTNEQGNYLIEIHTTLFENTSFIEPLKSTEKLTFMGKVIFDWHTKMPNPNNTNHFINLEKTFSRLHSFSYLRSFSSEIANDDWHPTEETLQVFSKMRFFDLDPEALRRPSLPGQTILGDKGQNLSSVLYAICQKPELKAALTAWIAELTPMDAVDFDFPADQTGRILVTLVEKNGQRISAYSASDGTLRFLAIIAALLGPDASGFYFFEEIDNGIHPARLHLLLSLIERQTKLGKVQVVATTHSPQLLSLLSRESLDHASLIYRLPDSQEGRIKRILDIPGAAELIDKKNIAELHAAGWLEDAVYFTSDDEASA